MEYILYTSDFSLEVKTKTTDSKTLTFAVGTRSSMVAAEDVWFQRKRCNVVVPTGRRVGMRLNKPELKCRLQNQHRRRRRTAGNERRGGRVQQYQQWGKLCEQEFGEEEELDRVNTTACWHQSWRTNMTEVTDDSR